MRHNSRFAIWILSALLWVMIVSLVPHYIDFPTRAIQDLSWWIYATLSFSTLMSLIEQLLIIYEKRTLLPVLHHLRVALLALNAPAGIYLVVVAFQHRYTESDNMVVFIGVVAILSSLLPALLLSILMLSYCVVSLSLYFVMCHDERPITNTLGPLNP